MGRKPKRTATLKKAGGLRGRSMASPSAASSYGRGDVALFSLTLFLSAALLFTVQPMFAKMVLPLLGGAPAVWNACLVFYQAALLAGYLYAHLSLKWLGPRRQAVLHLALLGLAWIALPIHVARRLAAAGHDVPGPLAVDAAGGFLGPAVSRRVGQCADAPGLVRPDATGRPGGILTSSMRPATSAACWPCWPIRW